METIVFGGGCFWCTEAVFKMLNGVISVTPGYAGGSAPHPSYEQVSEGDTGHAEVVRIEYDPALIRFDDLLTVFFATHDPTTVNRQGADVGSQYRSIILTTTPDQQTQARKFINDLNTSNAAGAPVVTEVHSLISFIEAESTHKDFYAKNPDQPYCNVVIQPKLEKVRQKFAELLKQ